MTDANGFAVDAAYAHFVKEDGDLAFLAVAGARWQHEKDRAEIEGLRAALEDRDKMHEEHVMKLEADRLRLTALLKEALSLKDHAAVLAWSVRATRAVGGEG